MADEALEADKGELDDRSWPVGYVVTWTTPAGTRHAKWYSRLGDARNLAKRLGMRGDGLDLRLFRTRALDEISDQKLSDVYDPRLATQRSNWADTRWRKKSFMRNQASRIGFENVPA